MSDQRTIIAGLADAVDSLRSKLKGDLARLDTAIPIFSVDDAFVEIVVGVLEQHKASQRAHIAELDTLFESLRAEAASE